MILLFPTLIDGIGGEEARQAFKVQCHMFYGRRVLEIRDGVEKWEGLNGKSRRLGEDGEVLHDNDDDDDGLEGEEGERRRRRMRRGREMEGWSHMRVRDRRLEGKNERSITHLVDLV